MTGAVRARVAKSAILFFVAGCYLLSILSNTQASTNEISSLSPGISSPQSEFSPSNARTEDGKLIPVEQFFSASRCAKCHQDTHTAWSESLHRNAAREPFYRESADILLRTRGIEPTRHCESCHTPVALFSGALTKESKQQQAPFTALDHEGVTTSLACLGWQTGRQGCLRPQVASI